MVMSRINVLNGVRLAVKNGYLYQSQTSTSRDALLHVIGGCHVVMFIETSRVDIASVAFAYKWPYISKAVPGQ